MARTAAQKLVPKVGKASWSVASDFPHAAAITKKIWAKIKAGKRRDYTQAELNKMAQEFKGAKPIKAKKKKAAKKKAKKKAAGKPRKKAAKKKKAVKKKAKKKGAKKAKKKTTKKRAAKKTAKRAAKKKTAKKPARSGRSVAQRRAGNAMKAASPYMEGRSQKSRAAFAKKIRRAAEKAGKSSEADLATIAKSLGKGLKPAKRAKSAQRPARAAVQGGKRGKRGGYAPGGSTRAVKGGPSTKQRNIAAAFGSTGRSSASRKFVNLTDVGAEIGEVTAVWYYGVDRKARTTKKMRLYRHAFKVKDRPKIYQHAKDWNAVAGELGLPTKSVGKRQRKVFSNRLVELASVWAVQVKLNVDGKIYTYHYGRDKIRPPSLFVDEENKTILLTYTGGFANVPRPLRFMAYKKGGANVITTAGIVR